VDLLVAAKPAAASPDDYVCPGQRPDAPFIGIDKVRRRFYRNTVTAREGTCAR